MRQVQIEGSVYSQYGEDGLIAFLLEGIPTDKRNNWFIDIGAGNGQKRSNTLALSFRGYSGMLYESNRQRCAQMLALYQKRFGMAAVGRAVDDHRRPQAMARGLRFAVSHMRVSSLHIEAHGLFPVPDDAEPDLCDVDIDSEDFFVARALLRRGVRPNVWIVEYNPNFGPELSLAVPLDACLPPKPKSRYRNLFYGASIRAWRRLMKRYGYKFVCVESHGSNAFFVKPGAVDQGRLQAIEWIEWADNLAWKQQFGTIGNRLRRMRELGFQPQRIGAQCE